MIRRWLWVACLVGVPATAQAQGLEAYDYEDLAFRGIGLDVGYIWPNKVEATPLYGVRVDLGYLGPGVRIQPRIGYWTSELKSSELERLADQLNALPAIVGTVTAADLGGIDWSDVSLGLDGEYVWRVARGVRTFAGAGLGVHLFNGSGEVIADTFVEDLLDSVTAGLSALAGIEAEPIERLRVYAEARYTLMDDVRYPGVTLGVAYILPSAPSADRAASLGRGGSR